MPLREQILRRRKDNRWIVGGLVVLLLLLSAIYYFVQRGRDLPADLMANRLLVFALWYINLVLIITIAFVLLRNLFKLVVERHNRILGSKFKTKLVATYFLLSLLPVLLLFGYGSQMLQGWIDRWFDEPAIKKVAEQGNAVAEELNRQIEERTLRDAQRVLTEVGPFNLENPKRRPALARRLQELLGELELDYVSVYNETGFVHAVVEPHSGMSDLPEPGQRFLLEALRKGRAVRVIPGGEGRLILTAVAGEAVGEDSRPLVVAGTLLDPVLASQSQQLIEAYQGYRQLEVSKSDIEATYRLTFLMVTLVILLITSWVGLYLARRVTVPIEALAEGTRRLSGGDLDHRVEVAADDELGVLVESFNSMTAQLRRNKEELIATNQRLAEERAVVAAVLENVAAGVVAVDQEGRILTCNRAALKMLAQQDVVGRPAGEAWSDPERAKLARLFEEDPGPSGRLARSLRLLLGGEWKTFEAKVRTMRDPGGEISGRVMVLEDLTELIKAQQMAAWNDAARRVAHEIKNPLTPIRLSAERLLKKYRAGDPDLGATLEEGVEIIAREVQAMKGMVDEFSRFARMRPPQPADTDFSRLVGETVRLYDGLKPGVVVESEIAVGAERALVDGEQIKRVLINLLDNAVEATPAPGRVKVTVAKHNGTLQIDVADTGDGIPADLREKLFLPHFSTKGRGTGLGLSIVHRIVHEHHGTVRVEANAPRGTVFKVELPQG